MRFTTARCILCGNPTRHRCTYCEEAVCARCRLIHKGKTYCTPAHRDRDAGIGHFVRDIGRLARPPHLHL